MDAKKVFVFLFIVHLLFLRGGVFTADEWAHYLLTKSISENFPYFLDLSTYLKHQPGSNPYYSYFYYNNEIHAGIPLGFPLFASTFYTLFGRFGINIFNLIANILISYIIFLIVSQKYGKNYGILAALLYVFITPSLFYVSSIWYHISTTLFFILSQYQFLKLKKRKGDVLLFSLFSSLTVLSSYYMIAPISLLYIYLLVRFPPKLKLLAFFSFALFLLPTFAYNNANFGSPFLGEYHIPEIVYSVVGGGESPSLTHELKRLLSSLTALLIYIDISKHYNATFQKSLLQSSPVLAFGLFFPLLQRTSRFIMLFTSNLLLIFMVAYADGDFGGWQLSMRYLMPVFPFFIISLSGLLSWLKISFEIKLICIIFFMEALFLLLYPIGISSEAYSHMKLLASFFAIALLLTGFTLIKLKKRVLKPIILTLIILSAFINLNEASYGSSYRSAHSLIEKSLNLKEGEKVVFPEKVSIVLPENEVVFYNNTSLNDTLKGDLTIVVKKSQRIQGCQIKEVRNFDNFYYYLIREDNLKIRIERLKSNYKILKLSCP